MRSRHIANARIVDLVREVPRVAVAVILLTTMVRAGETGLLTVRVRNGAAPIPRAEITVDGSASKSDSEGNAKLTVPAGEHELSIYHPAFAPETIKVIVLAGDEVVAVVQLRPVDIPTEVVTVRATRSGRIVEDQAVRVETVPEDEIEENSTVAPGNLSTLLTEMAGVQVQTISSTLGGASLRLQGIRGRYTQILTDELALFGEQPDVFSLLQVPPLDLAYVEVIKGPASALYGGSALGGVINLVSRRPPAEPEALLNLTSLGGADAVGFVPMQIGDQWSCTLLGGIHGQQRRDIDGDGWTDVPGFRRGYVRPRFFWSDERGRSLFFTVGWVGEDREGGTVRWGTTPTGQSFPETLGTRRADAGLVGHFLVGRDRLLVLKSSFSQAHHDLVFGGGEERDRRQFGFLELSLSGSDGHHTWVAGAAAERDAYRAEDLTGFDYTFTAPAVFLQDEFEAVRWLAVSASARADFHSAYGTFLNGRLSALIRPARGWSIRLSAGTGHSIPVPLTEETEVVGLSRILPLSDVAPERARGATADVGWSGGSWEVNGTLFGSTVEHPQILLDTSPEPGMLEFVSAATPTRTCGGEILVRFKHGNAQAIADYTYVHSVGEDSTGTGPVDIPLTPWHAAELAWIWEKEGKGRFGVEVSYTGRQRLEDDPYREVAPQYLVANMLGEIRVANAAVFLNAINLTDVRQSHYDPLVRPTQAPDGRWTTDPWAPLEGRMFNVGVRWEF